jgi:hypothetical protein
MAMKHQTNGHRRKQSEYAVIESQEELDRLIDSEARRLLHVSGAEFMKMKLSGTLPERPSVRALAMMAELGSITK